MRNLNFYHPLEDGINSRVQGVENRINEPEDRTIEVIRSKQWRKNRLKRKMNRTSGTCGTKNLTFISLEFQKER